MPTFKNLSLGILLGNKKKQSTNPCNNIMLGKRRQSERHYIFLFHLYRMPRICRSIEQEADQWLPRDRGGWEEMGSDY